MLRCRASSVRRLMAGKGHVAQRRRWRGRRSGARLRRGGLLSEAVWPLRPVTVGPVRRGWIFVYPGIAQEFSERLVIRLDRGGVGVLIGAVLAADAEATASVPDALDSMIADHEDYSTVCSTLWM